MGQSTTTFIEQYLETGGTVLKVDDQERCVFLGEAGCSVHPARPLVCRLYPLGIHYDSQGHETFSTATPHPQTEGIYGTDGVVDKYLGQQGVAPFLDANARYAELFSRMTALLEAADADAREEYDSACEQLSVRCDAVATVDWLDIDRMLGAEAGKATLETVVELHIAMIERDLDRLEAEMKASDDRPAQTSDVVS